MAKNILIVDDSSMMRLALRSVLQEGGYVVTEAIHGLDALAKMKMGERINLIICDVNMPEMDGITFVKTYRALPEFQYIPVLMMTTESDQDKKDIGRAAGVKAWMIKPFNKEVLMSAIGKLICA